MRILCIGANHKTTELALRERLSFTPADRRRALSDLRRRWPDLEAAIVSTCNRVEVYAARPRHRHPREDELRAWLAEDRGLRTFNLAGSLYTLSDGEAAWHLFAVAAGLDSLVPGEAQIVAQLKDAYAASLGAESAGATLTELFQAALHAAKKVRTETDIDAGKVSVASVAIDCVTEAITDLTGRCVLAVGAGKMTERMLRHLQQRGTRRLLVANRSAEHARQLAERCGGQVVPFDERSECLVQADVVLTSTAADGPLLTTRMVDRAQQRREGRPMLIVDIAVPRDVEPAVAGVPGVTLYNIDDLDRVVRATLRLRDEQRTAAEAILAQQVEAFSNRVRVRDVAPTIEAMYDRMRTVAAGELRDARNKLSTHEDAEEDARILERALHRTIRRIMHPAVQELRRTAGTDEAARAVRTLRRLFELDDEHHRDAPPKG